MTLKFSSVETYNFNQSLLCFPTTEIVTYEYVSLREFLPFLTFHLPHLSYLERFSVLVLKPLQLRPSPMILYRTFGLEQIVVLVS